MTGSHHLATGMQCPAQYGLGSAPVARRDAGTPIIQQRLTIAAGCSSIRLRGGLSFCIDHELCRLLCTREAGHGQCGNSGITAHSVVLQQAHVRRVTMCCTRVTGFGHMATAVFLQPGMISGPSIGRAQATRPSHHHSNTHFKGKQRTCSSMPSSCSSAAASPPRRQAWAQLPLLPWSGLIPRLTRSGICTQEPCGQVCSSGCALSANAVAPTASELQKSAGA
jgi:hypothetical protein